MLIVKNIEKSTMYNIQELHLFSFLSSIFTSSSIFSVHLSTNLSTCLFLHLHFSYSKYPPTSHDLSHPHSQLLRFQAYPLSHTPLSINPLHSDQHLSLFQRCLLLQTIACNRHIHLHVSWHFICLVSLILEIRLNTLTFKSFTTSGLHFFFHMDY